MSNRPRALARKLAPAALGFALIGAAAAAPVAAESGGTDPTYTITFENTTAGQWLTPPNFALHSNQVDVFSRNRPASTGVQAVAENGDVPALAAELDTAIDQRALGVSGVGPGVGGGPIPPGGSVSFEVSGDERRLSLVSMLICTNDGFAGIDAHKVPARIGRTQTLQVRAYDAGTEVNTERHDDLVPAPFCGGGGKGTGASNPALAENGRISRHKTITGVGDLNPIYDWRGPVATVTITRTN